jgi:3D (Asp-Asp-Asp) domain-containing protein
MAKSLFGGSAALTGALLLGSLFFQPYPSVAHDLEPNKQDNLTGTQVAGGRLPATDLPQAALVAEVKLPTPAVRVDANDDPPPPPPKQLTAAQVFTATAYALRGRTASGRNVARGLIAADRRVLPLGTRVRVEAGSYTGEYLVADHGSAVRGRKIDIWVPSTREAMRFGRRPVKLTVLNYATKPAASKANH